MLCVTYHQLQQKVNSLNSFQFILFQNFPPLADKKKKRERRKEGRKAKRKEERKRAKSPFYRQSRGNSSSYQIFKLAHRSRFQAHVP